MGRRGQQVCTACTHHDVEALDAAIDAGLPYRTIAKTFSMSPATVGRHKAHKARRLNPNDASGDLIRAVDSAIDEMRSLQTRAKRNKHAGVAADLLLKTSRELRALFALRAQFVRTSPSIPVERSEPEMSDEQLRQMATIFLARQKKVTE
jgi:hypothetical protein